MDRADALEDLADGHAVYSPKVGKDILEALGVPWSDDLTFEGHSSRGPGNPKGLLMVPGAEGEEVVSALTLGRHACAYFGLRYENYLGRGKQGQEYSFALKKHFWAEEAKGGGDGR